jgi:DNA-binding CsgD family transcriptional regulator
MTLNAYQLKKLIPPLYPTYSEVELAERFSLTISDVRQYLDGPIPLNSAAWNEIVALYPDASDYTLTKLYNTTAHQVKKWSEGKGQDKIIMSQIEVQELLDQGKSIKEVSKLANISMQKIKATIPKASKRQMPSKEQLLVMLETNVEEYLKANSLTATANHFGITPSAIIHGRKRNAKQTN